MFVKRGLLRHQHANYWAAFRAEGLSHQRLVPGQGKDFYLEKRSWGRMRRAYMFAECRALLYHKLKHRFKQTIFNYDRLFFVDIRNYLEWGESGHFPVVIDWYKMEIDNRRRYRRFLTTSLKIHNWSYKRKNLDLSRSL